MKKLVEKLLSLRVMRYLIAGALTTLVNYVVYILLVGLIGITWANAVAWVCAVAFAYWINKLFVFQSRAWRGVWLKEAVSFFLGRAATGVLEIAGLPLLVSAGLDATWFGVEGLPAKVIITVVVQVLNYVFSACLAFRKKKEE